MGSDWEEGVLDSKISKFSHFTLGVWIYIDNLLMAVKWDEEFYVAVREQYSPTGTSVCTKRLLSMFTTGQPWQAWGLSKPWLCLWMMPLGVSALRQRSPLGITSVPREFRAKPGSERTEPRSPSHWDFLPASSSDTKTNSFRQDPWNVGGTYCPLWDAQWETQLPPLASSGCSKK